MPIAPNVKPDRLVDKENKEANRRKLAIEFAKEAGAYAKVYKGLEKKEVTLPECFVMMTLASFACELFSKALLYWLMSDDAFKVIKEHRLKALFDKFSEEIQDKITSEWSGAESHIKKIDDNYEFCRYYPEYINKDCDYSSCCTYLNILEKLSGELIGYQL